MLRRILGNSGSGAAGRNWLAGFSTEGARRCPKPGRVRLVIGNAGNRESAAGTSDMRYTQRFSALIAAHAAPYWFFFVGIHG